jgi:hypothetical protein
VRRRIAAIAAITLFVAATGPGAGAGGGTEKVAFTAADQAAARAAVLVRADLGTLGTWTGGHVKPSLSPSPSCPGYSPDAGDLVLTGDSATKWESSEGLQFASEAQVLRTAAMVARDWRRTVLPSGVLACLRSQTVKALGVHGSVVSVRRLAVPRIAAYAAGFRIVFNVPTKSGTARMMVDSLLVGRSRTEISLTTTSPYAAAGPVFAAELRLARILAGRAR